MAAAKIISMMALGLAMVTLLVSCSNPQAEGYSPEAWKYRKQMPRKFKPITGYHLELVLVSKRLSYMAGESVTLTFRLVNRSDRTVNIPEWMMTQSDNLKLYYRLYKQESENAPFKAEDWQCIQPTLPPTPERSELTLNPQNSVIIVTKLPFVKKLATPEKPQQFQIVAAVNLSSLNVKSDIVTIAVK